MRESDADRARRADDGFERIAPAELNPAAAPPSRRVAGSTLSTRTLLIGFAALLSLAAALLFGLPALIEASGPAAPSPPLAETSPTPTPPAATPVASAAAPASAPAAKPIWDDEALLRAREQAQGLAQQVAGQLDGLRRKAVQRWAATPFAAAEAQVAAAAAQFDAKAFPAAVDGYRAASEALAALDKDSVRQRDAAKAAGQSALASGDAAAAAAAFDLALAIAPDDAAAQRGRTRVERLPAVRTQLQIAATAEASGDTAAAATAYRAALKLDPDTAIARDALGRIEGRAAGARFEKTMAAALAALDAGQLDAAERALKAAAAQRPGDAAIGDAEARLVRLRRDQQRAALEAQAAADVRSEDWAAAVKRHEAVLAIDPTLVSAQDGLAAARSRAALSARLDAWIAQPGRLGSDAVHAEAQQALASARAIASPGPRLQKQIASLEALLVAAVTPLDVALQSDDKTEVTVYRVGPQGRFTDKRLQLKPGRYTAVGARPGYVDVRVEFDVGAGMPAAPVLIRCEEKL